ncbi:hypothetical protein M405DRAFT_824326 [Rhizopogon salebrosus TDB-379]|nr:hypothetical protein M405DRAFT_824326 [Rhizopogon salebrosus TDB-379]
MQNVKDFTVRPKYSNSVEDATYRRDEYQEVASGVWGCGGAKASTRQYSKQRFGVGNGCCELDVVASATQWRRP